MSLEIIAAVANNNVIGHQGQLPWRLPSDLKRFRNLTLGHTVVMGRKTWDSLPRKPLGGRINLVLSNHFSSLSGAEVIPNWQEVIGRAKDHRVFVIGGETLYKLALPEADCIHLTEVYTTPVGDTRFPQFDRRQWKVTASLGPLQEPGDDHPYHFVSLCR